MRGRRPSASANSSTFSRACATAGLVPDSSEYTPEMILICPECRPNTFSSASEISPTVAFARAAATESASRFWSSPRLAPSAIAAAAPVSASNADVTARSSRSSRSRASLASCSARTPALSTARTSIFSSAVNG